MIAHEITWTEPAPLWSEATIAGAPEAERAKFHQPAILRFTTDAFMEEFLNVLATDPLRLGEYRVRPETWRGFVPPQPAEKPAKAFALAFQRLGLARQRLAAGDGIALPTRPPESDKPVSTPPKLYQAAHQRYYLVTACLVCETTGLPDRKVDTSREEKASFVLRRLLPPTPNDPNENIPFDSASWKEHAFVSQSGQTFWQPLRSDADVLVAGEEQLSLFPINFQQSDQRRRRLLAGLIPVGKREAYMGAGKPPVNESSGPGSTTRMTARKVLFRTQVAEPWKVLVDRALAFDKFQDIPNQTDFDEPPPENERGVTLGALREQIQTVSWLVLADFANFLESYLPDVHAALGNPASTLTGAQGDLLAALRGTTISDTLETSGPPDSLADGTVAPSVVASSLADALARLIADPGRVASMEKTVAPYTRGAPNADWPDFLFPLADPIDLNSAQPVINQPVGFTTPEEDNAEVVPPPPPALSPKAAIAETFRKQIDRFAALVIRAIPPDAPAEEPAPALGAQQPADLRAGYFVIRCVYERPACGPLHDDTISPPTQPFQLAGFFDPDAPARPIRIGLPLDTTPAGLRKFDKNTVFMISDVLCGQIQRLKGLTLGDLVRSVLPWPLHKDLSVPDGGPCARSSGGPSLGMICSLSIPIITLCALILLIIMVTLLDLVFRWLPFFVICFPVPGLKAKD